MSLRTENLTYAVDAGFGSKLCLLNPTSISLPKSSVTAIMGPSGAGKTTLMDLISGTKHSGYFSGEIYVGDKALGNNIKSVVAHVECFDFHIEEFTVLENMYFTAMLRVGKWMSHEECMKLCLKVADIISLSRVLDVVVGSELKKGISGGQKKLLSIANELLGFPTVLCLDEPTSGLDSTTSLQLAQVLENLAKNHHKTIVCTVHQPSAEMLMAWQHLVLIGKGSIVYSGSILGLDPYLTRIGCEVPTKECGMSIVEFVVHLLSSDDDVHRLIDQWGQQRGDMDGGGDEGRVENAAELGGLHRSTENGGADFDPPIIARSPLPVGYQILLLTLRHALYTWKTLHGVRGMLARNILGGVFYGIVYYRNGDELDKLNSFAYPDKDGIVLSPYVYNSVTLSFAVPLFIVVINMVPIPSMFAMSRYCNKEQGNKLYSSFARWLSLLLVDIPTLFLGTCCYILIMYCMSGISQNWYRFSYMVMFGSFLGYAQAQLCAHISFSAIQGFVLMAVLCCYQLVFSGYFVEKSDLPQWLRWAVYTSFMRWTTGQLMMNQFGGYLRHQGDLVLELFEYENFEFWRSSQVVAVYFIGLELLMLITLFLPRPTATKVSSEVIKDAASITENPIVGDLATVQQGGAKSADEASCHQSTADLHIPGDRSTPVIVDDFLLEKDDVFTAAKSLPDSKKVDFLFRQITYTLQCKLDGTEGKQLLKGIDGAVHSGELCAVMGMSGSGKTTLLNVLAGRANVGIIGGAVNVNGDHFPGMKIANSVAQRDEPTYAYVMQDDAHCSLFTVKETLEFAAMLRQRVSDRTAVQGIVEETLQVMGLNHIADHFVGVIGDSMISRGQLRRLTVGVEIVNSPSMIFLDEPTTGLDSFLAGTVVQGLKTLSQSGRTLLCTIHSPSPSLFSQFDKLLLLSEGHVLYFGPTSECEDYFKTQCGFISVSTNPADFIIHVARETRDNPDSCQFPLEHMAAMAKKQFYSDSDILRDTGPTLLESDSKSDVTGIHYVFNLMAENINADIEDVKKSRVTIRVLYEREFLKELRRWKFWLTNIVRAVMLGCLLGYVWGDLTPDGSVLNYTGLTLVVYITSNLWMVEIVPILQEDKVIFYRERDANATSTFASWVVMSFPTSMALAFVVLAILVPVYTISDLRHGTKYFLQFYFVCYIQLLANLQLGVFVSTFTPNTMVNVLIFPSLTLTIQSMLCGYAAMITTFKSWYRWITYIIPAKWYMGILFISQLKGDDNISADFDSIISDYGWDYPMRDQFLYLVLILVAHKLLAYAGMRYLTSAKQ